MPATRSGASLPKKKHFPRRQRPSLQQMQVMSEYCAGSYVDPAWLQMRLPCTTMLPIFAKSKNNKTIIDLLEMKQRYWTKHVASIEFSFPGHMKVNIILVFFNLPLLESGCAFL
jgi:hypothetical protein